ncbi:MULTISPECIES: TetR/AcrR family transcriptional regulator [Streptomyces]|uniref:TetR/AcrR family transcriptional regulator n=1 Tax=Streptomyces TaxID=1883 RepID=UPI00084BC44C|nr:MULTISPECIES: TetR/AcrR family transcriptional regulator [Streptomyces]TFI22667.1 TetR/AcrR family transcriptional regulator [Streptomyces sp. 4R-3d]
MIATMESPGRREQNKQKTRQAIEEAAARLFDEHGYADTTVSAIAQAAGVGERTFFRYFPTKEALVVGQVRDLIPRLAQLLRERPAAEPPYEAMRNAVLELAAQHDIPPAIFTTGPPVRLGPESRADRFLLAELEAQVTDALRERLSANAPDPGAAALRLQAAVKARAGVSALRALFVLSADEESGPLTVGQFAELVQDAFAALEGP